MARKKIKIRFFLLIGLFALAIVPTVDASCVIPPPIFNEIRTFNDAHTIFVGKVINVYHPHTENTPVMEFDIFTFDVDYYLKGKLKDNDVMSPHSSTGYDDFVEGQSYLVFAFGGINEVGLCSPPIALSSATPVLILFYLTQYFLVIPIVIGGIVFAVWGKRKSYPRL